MSRGKKLLLGILGAGVVLALILAVVIPMFINLDRYRPQVVERLEKETGKPAKIGKLSLTLLPSVSIRVDDFSLGNPDGFPAGDFVRAKRIYAVVDGRALLHRQVIIRSLEIDDPALNLLQDTRGRWNFENPPAPRDSGAAADNSPSSFTLGVISSVKVSNAALSAANLVGPGRAGPTYFQGKGVDIVLEQVDLNAFTGAASAALRPGSIPEGASGFGGATLLWADAPGGSPAAQGTLGADELRFSNLQVTRVKSKLRLYPKHIFFDDLNFDLYDGHATGDLAADLGARNPHYDANAKLSGVNVAKLLEAFPDARGKMSGTMDGQMKLSGDVTHSTDPLAGMRGTGNVSVRNGQMPSLQLNKNLMLLARLSSLGPAAGDPSSFSLISTDLNIANGRIASKKILVQGNGVDVDGAGSMSLEGAGEMDYQGVAKLAAQANAVSGLLANLSGATMENGKLSFPFTVSGALANPRFTLKGGGGQLGGLQNLLSGQSAQGQNQQQTNPLEGLSGLFKKKQQPQ